MNVFKTVALSASLAFTSLPAFADAAGYAGDVVALNLHQSGSDEYGSAEGKLVMDEGGGTLRTYKWAGSLCSGRNLKDADRAILFNALSTRTVKVRPYYKTGSGGTRCLTSILLVQPGWEELIGF